MKVTFGFIREDKPAEKWRAQFNKTWQNYREWYLSEGDEARPNCAISVGELEKHMPELLPIYRQLVEFRGNEDIASRFLTMYCPPAYNSGCTQLAFIQGTNTLIRNYDYNLRFFEGNMIYTDWLQPVIGMSDNNWGLLDGMNKAGLAISLTFGGRTVTGVGFGIPIIIRYILEIATNVADAVEILKRIPVHMSHNVTVMDKHSNYATVYLAPDKLPEVVHDPIATNHQQTIDWEEFALKSATVQRKEYLQQVLSKASDTEDSIINRFLKPPLYKDDFENNFGTLYTVAYKLQTGEVVIKWPGKSVKQSFKTFKEKTVVINFGE